MKYITAERVIHAQIYDDRYEEWSEVEMTVEEFLDAYTDEGCPTVVTQPDLSEYSDKLWRAAYERGKKDAQPEIIRCSQCKYAEVADKEDAQDGYTCQFHRGSIWFSGSYCSWAERRTDEDR